MFLMLPLLLWSTAFAVNNETVLDNSQQLEQASNASDIEMLPDASYMVSVRRSRKDSVRYGSGHICGGALITPNLVLTAAHCFVDQTKYDGSFLNESEFKVVLGSPHRFANKTNTTSIQLVTVLTQQAKFDFKTYDKDIALCVLKWLAPVKLMTPIKMIENIKFPTKKRCQISGWNRIEDERLHSNVSLIEKNACKLIGGNLSRHLKPGMLCVLIEDDLADSGGPLICDDKLVGIQSWNIIMPGMPSIYTNVLYYRKWILDTASAEHWNRTNSETAEDESTDSVLNQAKFYEPLLFVTVLVLWHF